jgi:hypothetical protein
MTSQIYFLLSRKSQSIGRIGCTGCISCRIKPDLWYVPYYDIYDVKAFDVRIKLYLLNNNFERTNAKPKQCRRLQQWLDDTKLG